MLRELVEKNRSYRRFYQEVPLDKGILKELVGLARLSGSAGNLQPLKYILSCEEEENRLIFQHLRWAGYLKDWAGPVEGEKPSGYIVILGDTTISKNYWWDHGLACQSILLGACEKGLGGCMFGAFDRNGLIRDLDIPEQYEILAVIALGKPKETVVLENLTDGQDIKYWRDDAGVHHVPKRALEDIILER
ncbi:nitroreductase family protein [Geosporobacter ferrireducens]|uniref:Nitroreductase n=1 Tax=Geosporobacter ferrireducens TaxID=1424294 RepID=A0A1D8GLE5_9FIRM|nr:nitroreductase family protein [Geosporobacter ferrireducens]AOT71723.1 nitroreductase [Geosporobacter ferrireducens]MTI55500.1 nitroreductase family protein [Geosporobacter ferrireducens]